MVRDNAGYGCANAYPAALRRRPAFADAKGKTLSKKKEEQKRAWRSGARPKHLMVRLTLEEHAEITRRARLARQSAASFLTYCGLKNKLPVMRESPPAAAESRAEIEKILREMRRVGVNLNSLQHAYNRARSAGGMTPVREEFEQAVMEIGDVIGVLVVLLKEKL